MASRMSDTTHAGVPPVPDTDFNGLMVEPENLKKRLQDLRRNLHPLAGRRLTFDPNEGPEVVEPPRTYSKDDVDEAVGAALKRILDVLETCTENGEHAAGHVRVVAHGLGVGIPDE